MNDTWDMFIRRKLANEKKFTAQLLLTLLESSPMKNFRKVELVKELNGVVLNNAEISKVLRDYFSMGTSAKYSTFYKLYLAEAETEYTEESPSNAETGRDFQVAEKNSLKLLSSHLIRVLAAQNAIADNESFNISIASFLVALCALLISVFKA